MISDSVFPVGDHVEVHARVFDDAKYLQIHDQVGTSQGRYNVTFINTGEDSCHEASSDDA